MRFTILRAGLVAAMAGILICLSAQAVKPMTKADKSAHKIKVTNLKPARTGSKSGITRSNLPIRRPASGLKSLTKQKISKKPKPVGAKTLSATRKKSSRSPASQATKVRTNKLNPILKKGRTNSQKSSEVRVPDAFDMHSGANPIRGT